MFLNKTYNKIYKNEVKDMANKIEILEVGPRDGFQNLNQYIALEDKIKIIDDLITAGVKRIQHSSFVNPRVLPQFEDSVELTKLLLKKYPNFDFVPLVPNFHGARTAYDLGIKKISYVMSLSGSHNKANINRTHEESFKVLKDIINTYKNLSICVDLATTFGCPFEGKFSNEDILKFVGRISNTGVKEITLADTIGIANPKQVREVIKALKREYPNINFRIHMHDTRNMGMVNTLVAIECGITDIDSSLGGLGGCPFVPDATGNVATEDMVYMLNEMGYDTGIDFRKILEAALYERSIIDGNFSGHQINLELY